MACGEWSGRTLHLRKIWTLVIPQTESGDRGEICWRSWILLHRTYIPWMSNRSYNGPSVRISWAISYNETDRISFSLHRCLDFMLWSANHRWRGSTYHDPPWKWYFLWFVYKQNNRNCRTQGFFGELFYTFKGRAVLLQLQKPTLFGKKKYGKEN